VTNQKPNRCPDESNVEGPPPPSLLRNYISFAGWAIVAASLTCIALLILIDVTGSAGDNPYSDLITFILLPSILIFGLVVVLVGALWERRRRRHLSHDQIAAYPVLDLNDPRRRRAFLVFLCTAFAFLFLSAFGSYRAYEYTESVTFCGQACHSVMKPEFVAYNASPHARIRCVECHVGGGAEAYVRSKFNGMHQLYGVVTGHYNRRSRPRFVICVRQRKRVRNVHWSQKYNGEELKLFDHYAYDEENSLNQTRMLIKVGGGDLSAGPVGGIHWHMSIANEVSYIASDDKRQLIPWVRMKSSDGKTVDFATRDFSMSANVIEQSPKRKMDCIDCHSRPAHIYLSPNEAIDQAFSAGRLDRSLPFLKARAVESLSKPYATNDEAVSTIASDIDTYYKASYPGVYETKKEIINGAISELQSIYQTYFFRK
jgi:nitrate/TMAO reductase-like tetraheme cytochrome c subunit